MLRNLITFVALILSTMLFLILLNLDSDAQDQTTFARRLPPTCFIKSVVSSNNGYLAVGGCADDTRNHPFIVKLDLKGKLVWRKEFSFVGNYGGNFEHIMQLRSGQYILIGTRNIPGTVQVDPFITKITSSGTLIWKKIIPGERNDSLYTVIETDDGDYLFGGQTESYASNSFSDGWIIKLNSSGGFISSRTFNRTNVEDTEDVREIIKLEDGFLFVGSSDFFSIGPSRALVIKTDPSGVVKWAKTYFKKSGWLQIFSASAAPDQGAFIAGEFGSADFGENLDAFLMRIDSNGAIKWKKSYGTPDIDEAFSVTTSPDGGAALAGYVKSRQFAGDDALLLKVDPTGRTEWKRVFGTESFDHLENVSISMDGGFIGSGIFNSIYPVIFKLNPIGIVQNCNIFAAANIQVKNPQITISSTPIAGGAVKINLQDLGLKAISSNRTISNFCDLR